MVFIKTINKRSPKKHPTIQNILKEFLVNLLSIEEKILFIDNKLYLLNSCVEKIRRS